MQTRCNTVKDEEEGKKEEEIPSMAITLANIDSVTQSAVIWFSCKLNASSMRCPLSTWSRLAGRVVRQSRALTCFLPPPQYDLSQ